MVLALILLLFSNSCVNHINHKSLLTLEQSKRIGFLRAYLWPGSCSLRFRLTTIVSSQPCWSVVERILAAHLDAGRGAGPRSCACTLCVSVVSHRSAPEREGYPLDHPPLSCPVGGRVPQDPITRVGWQDQRSPGPQFEDGSLGPSFPDLLYLN